MKIGKLFGVLGFALLSTGTGLCALVFENQTTTLTGQLVLSVHATANETGCSQVNGSGVFVDGSATCDSGTLLPRLGTIPAGGSEVGLAASPPTVAANNISNPWDLRVVLDADEPNGNPSLTVTDLVVKFYDPVTHALVWHSAEMSAFTSTLFADARSPNFIFSLTDNDAASLQAAVFNQPNFGLFQMAIEVSATGSQGLQENFYFNSAGNLGVPTPEPATWLTLAAGLLFVGALAKLR